MDQIAHTQKPWHVRKTISNAGLSVSVMDDNGGVICLCKSAQGNKQENATLIAAAPDLLEALESAYEFVKAQCELYNKGDNSKGDFTLLNEIETAIAKATGEK